MGGAGAAGAAGAAAAGPSGGWEEREQRGSHGTSADGRSGSHETSADGRKSGSPAGGAEAAAAGQVQTGGAGASGEAGGVGAPAGCPRAELSRALLRLRDKRLTLQSTLGGGAHSGAAYVLLRGAEGKRNTTINSMGHVHHAPDAAPSAATTETTSAGYGGQQAAEMEGRWTERRPRITNNEM